MKHETKQLVLQEDFYVYSLHITTQLVLQDIAEIKQSRQILQRLCTVIEL